MANKEQKNDKDGMKQKRTLAAPTTTATAQSNSSAESKNKKAKRGGTAIRQHTCVHEFQDRTYGKGNRVFNVGGTETSTKYCCTVCGAKV